MERKCRGRNGSTRDGPMRSLVYQMLFGREKKQIMLDAECASRYNGEGAMIVLSDVRDFSSVRWVSWLRKIIMGVRTRRRGSALRALCVCIGVE